MNGRGVCHDEAPGHDARVRGLRKGWQQAASSKQQAASSKQQAASSKQQAASSKQQRLRQLQEAATRV
ncbi:hypothetical protein, partial [Streptomyces sp. 404i]|uniref:hypothetical protein n=1 Tax=Streptomyces sp. 404i TaxID=2824902 RepID=UPI001B3904B4